MLTIIGILILLVVAGIILKNRREGKKAGDTAPSLRREDQEKGQIRDISRNEPKQGSAEEHIQSLAMEQKPPACREDSKMQ